MQLEKLLEKVVKNKVKKVTHYRGECHLILYMYKYMPLLRRYPFNHQRGSHLLVMVGRMVFAWAVSSVATAFGPKESE